MDPIERSGRLRREADEMMQAIDLPGILAPCGPVVPTGSYFLDVMAYPDVDLYIPTLPIAQLFETAGRFAASELVSEVVFQRSRVPSLPGGLYLKLRIAYGAWERPWKIDIWALDEALIEERMVDMLRFQAALAASLREQIIRYKCSILTAAGRTPMYSGYYVYKAFVDEGLADHAAVTRYLRDHGIQVEGTEEGA